MPIPDLICATNAMYALLPRVSEDFRLETADLWGAEEAMLPEQLFAIVSGCRSIRSLLTDKSFASGLQRVAEVPTSEVAAMLSNPPALKDFLDTESKLLIAEGLHPYLTQSLMTELSSKQPHFPIWEGGVDELLGLIAGIEDECSSACRAAWEGLEATTTAWAPQWSWSVEDMNLAFHPSIMVALKMPSREFGKKVARVFLTGAGCVIAAVNVAHPALTAGATLPLIPITAKASVGAALMPVTVEAGELYKRLLPKEPPRGRA